VVDDTKKLTIYLRLQITKPKTPTQFEEILLFGPVSIKEEMLISYPHQRKTFSFHIGPTSFFQPNTLMAEKLFSLAILHLPKKKYDLVYDLYCGSGSIGMIFSQMAQEVIGIELNEEAVKDGQKNIEANHIQNCKIMQGDVGKILLSMPKKYPDLVIVDPPRAGLDPLALHQIKILRPKVLLYISCNPYTQKENIEELIKEGYQLQILQPVDQFPHTPHMENIAVMTLV
jgi:23S rRNA (uracil1939-C5)-methyltransferase